MKKIMMIILLTNIGATTLWAGDKVKTAEIKTTINCDHCKVCPSCSARLEKAVYGQKGVKRVDVDDQKKIIKVVYNADKVSLDAIKNTIANAGYDADDVKAPSEAFAKLDGCCRGAE